MGIPLCVICCLSLAAFNICSLCLIFVNLINMCLGVFHLGFILFVTLWVSWTWVTISFSILGKFSTLISSSIYSWPFFLSSSSGTPMLQMLEHLTHLHLRQLLISMIPLSFTLLFWVLFYKPFLCFLSREDLLAFVKSWFGGAEFSQLLLVCKTFDFSFISE